MPEDRRPRSVGRGPSGPTAAALALLMFQCAGEGPKGIAATVPTGGPKVVWDLFAEPLPEIPLPNNIATRLDPSSPTGRRVNISLVAPTRVERGVREKADALSGFSIMGTISVRFDGPLALAPFIEHHWRNRDFADDLVYVINVDPKSPRFGELIPLDLGQGNFPIVIDSDGGAGGGEKPFGIFENDPHRTSDNILFETVDEDRNCNGALDPGEDADFDGVLDKPNILRESILPQCSSANRPAASAGQLFTEGCTIVTQESQDGACVPKCWPEDCLLTFYERETNTLLIRPLVPLDQETTYAVVLTNRITGADRASIESPFAYVNHTNQTNDLGALEKILRPDTAAGISPSEVAFAWTFTTQSVTRDMEAVRQGLYGSGPLAWLAERYPPDLHIERIFSDGSGQPNPFIFPGSTLLNMLETAGTVLSSLGAPPRKAPPKRDGAGDLIEQLIGPLEFTDYIVAGEVRSPYFLTDKDGIAEPSADPFGNPLYPADSDESFEIDLSTGRATVGRNWVTFWCFVPKAGGASPHGSSDRRPRSAADGGAAGRNAPFPVGIHSHGYTSTRLEAIAFAGQMNRMGIAYCGVDAAGHGMGRTNDPLEDTLRMLIRPFKLEPFLDNVFFKGRARDLNNDGTVDSGGDFWTADLFHTRDVVRQTAVDYMQLIRMFRSWDGAKKMDVDGDGSLDAIAGDFNGDGVVDFGGPIEPQQSRGKYHMSGCSLGGIMTAYTMGLEPALIAGGAGSGAAGLTDVALRTVQGGVVEAVYLPLMGPVLSGKRAKEDPTQTEIKFVAVDVNDRKSIVFLKTPSIQPGTRVETHNLVNTEWDWAVADEDGGFRLALPADAVNATEKRALLARLGKGILPDAIPQLGGEEPLLFGDALEIRICRATDDAGRYDPFLPCGDYAALRETTEEFKFQGAVYKAGSRIAAIYEGLGLKRNTPELRRFLSIAQTVIDPGDPGGSAPHYFSQPLDFSYDRTLRREPGDQHILVIPTVGDMNVPVNTGIHIARAAGLIDLGFPSPRRTLGYLDKMDRVENDVILDHFVAEGVERLRRFAGPPWNDARKILFDLDDMDDGADCWEERGGACKADSPNRGQSMYDAPDLRVESLQPLRATRPLSDLQPGVAGVSGMRIPYMRDRGQHCFGPTDPDRPFNMDQFVVYQIARFLSTDGAEISNDACLADASCSYLPQ